MARYIDAVNADYILSKHQEASTNRQYWKGFRDARKVLADIPTVDIDPVVHGTWAESGYAGFMCCSGCRECYISVHWLNGKKWGYCPNCGAKMDLKEGADDV